MGKSRGKGYISMSIRVGTAPDSWGIWFPDDSKQVSWQQCLDEMQKAGYKTLELGPWGYLPTDPIRLKEELSKRGLELIATTLMTDIVFINDLQPIYENLDKILSLQCHFSSAKYLVLIDGMYTDLFTGDRIARKELNDDEWNQMIVNIKKIVDYVKAKLDIQVVFHPHAETHVETEEEIERLLKDIDIDLCLDTGHHLYAGGDPITFIQKHKDRIKYLHLKDCNKSIREKMQEHEWAFARGVQSGVMCDPESGDVDFIQLTKILERIQYTGEAVVEQDMYPAPAGTPFKIAKQTLNYFKEIGLVK